MGKAQSKRSVDITTDTKKSSEDEVTEKMEKIEDLDKREVVNGDATISEKTDEEKKVSDVENDKDLTTEKDVDVQASGDVVEHQNTAETSKDEAGVTIAEEISPLADENIKKSKKEKVKKKWSFRSISFGKKDKQKPAKNEDTAEDGGAATNEAEDEKTVTDTDDTQKDKTTNEKNEKSVENHENGNATQQELNEDELNEEKGVSDEKSNDITANTTNNTITTETCASVQKETAAVSSELSEKTENTAVTNEINLSDNATVDDASKNINGIDEKMNATSQEALKTDVTSASVEGPLGKKNALVSAVTTNGEVVDQIHQNGDHGESEQEVAEKPKAQIEVNTNTDNKVSAATLDYISNISINPSNVQIHVQDLNVSSEKPDEIIQINQDEFVVQNTVSDLISEAIENDKSFEEKVAVDLSPPPLPISPPPSQVSVFAFKSNDESVEAPIETKNLNSSNNNKNENEEKEVVLSPRSEHSLKEVHNSQGADTISSEPIVDKIASHDQEVSQICGVNDNENVDMEFQENKTLYNEIIESVCKEENEKIEVLSFDLSEELITDEHSVNVAAAVINEITETAAEIVIQQLECNEKRITDGQPAQNSKREEIINPETTVENVVACTNEKKSEEEEEENHDVGGIKFKCKIANSLQEPSSVPEQKNDTIECSLNFTASDSIQQCKGEMISLKKSENLDEERLDPIKEFATAKDIKDNVTVAEITQDLAVTCE